MTEEHKEGWAFPMPTARKAHYFVEGRSLCGNYGLIFGQLHPDEYASSDDCKACRTRLEKRKAKA